MNPANPITIPNVESATGNPVQLIQQLPWWQDKNVILAILNAVMLIFNSYQSRNNGVQIEKVNDNVADVRQFSETAAVKADVAATKAEVAATRVEQNAKRLGVKEE